MSGYGSFAKHYDALTQNVDYNRRAGYFDTLIRRYSVLGENNSLLLDLACGTGSLSLELAALGYDVIGADVSVDMLSIAMQKAAESPYRLMFLHQAMDKLDLYGTVGVIVCALDSLNHLAGEKELSAVFAKVSLFTEPSGLFLFDVNTAYKHREILGNNAYIFELEGLFCAWRNTYHSQHHRVEIHLDFFEKTGGGTYSRTSEEFSERIFSQNTLNELLGQNGFKILAVYGDDSLDPPGETTQRLVYVAQKSSI